MNPFPKADELTRRQFVSNAARAYLGVHLLPMLGGSVASAAPAAAATAAGKGTAKSVIYLYMNGGMSHVDTFDPKPANKEVMGKTEAIRTKADDVMIGNYLPKTAAVMDHVCVINSMNSTQGAHEQANYMMHTSYELRGTIKHPGMGAWVTKLGGRINPELPAYVAINGGNYSTGGFMGAKYSAAVVGSPEDGLLDSERASGVSDEDFNRRLTLADRMNRKFHGRYENKDVKAYQELYNEAITLMKSKDLDAFDISKESAATRNLYGTTRFAQGCLLARRLVDNGVRFVEVQLGGWDTHTDNFTAVAARCAELDQAYAALISDLAKSGRLKDTLVVVATEFGRTPEIQPEHKDGRDHYPKAFTCLLAGGGVKGGMKYGKTDESAANVVEGKVSIQDFNATIAYSLGLPYQTIVMSPSMRPFRFADKGNPITAVFA
jgi:hypothetical protein